MKAFIALLIIIGSYEQSQSYSCTPNFTKAAPLAQISCSPIVGTTFTVSLLCPLDGDDVFFYYLAKCNVTTKNNNTLKIYLLCNHTSILANNSNCELYYAAVPENTTYGTIHPMFQYFDYTDPYTGIPMEMTILPYSIKPLSLDQSPRSYFNKKFMDASKNISNFNGAFGYTDQSMYPNARIVTFNAYPYNSPM